MFPLEVSNEPADMCGEDMQLGKFCPYILRKLGS